MPNEPSVLYVERAVKHLFKIDQAIKDLQDEANINLHKIILTMRIERERLLQENKNYLVAHNILCSIDQANDSLRYQEELSKPIRKFKKIRKLRKNKIKKILIRRDNLSPEEADALIEDIEIRFQYHLKNDGIAKANKVLWEDFDYFDIDQNLK